MSRHHAGGVYSLGRYGPKPSAGHNSGRHYGCIWESYTEEILVDRRNRKRKIIRMMPVKAKNSRYMPHVGGGMRSKT